MSQFYHEVFEQPQAIRDTVEKNIHERMQFEGKPFLFTGMGSSLAASELLVAYLNSHGQQSIAIDNSELLYYHKALLNHYQLIVVSQSGESIEAKELIEQHKKAYAITNTRGSSVASGAAKVFYTFAGEEKAIASSKSFTTTAALLLLLGAKIVQKDLTEDLKRAADSLEQQLEQAEYYRKQIGEFLNPEKPLTLLGRGPSVFTARQGALTLKETARMYTEAMSAAQFRHGPFELIKENSQFVFFNPKGITYELNRDYVKEMAGLGAKVLYVSDELITHPNVKSLQITSVNEFVSVIPYSLVTQLAAVELSKKRGLVAGQAELITKVTRRQ